MDRNGKSSINRPRTTTRLLGDSAANAQLKARGKHTSRKLRGFLTSLQSVPEALHSPRPNTINLNALAARLGVEPARLLPLIEHNYLTLVCVDPPVVYEPPPAAVEWLKQMFTPLMTRPFLTTDMVADLEAISGPDVRRLCLAYNIPIYSDPVFGELLSIASFYRFHTQLHHYREPSRFDRQAMIVALMQAVDPAHYKKDLRPPSFSQRMENEIRRVAGLNEPERTDAALRLCEAYKDARSLVDCVAAVRGKKLAKMKGIERIEKIISVETPV